MKYRSIILLGAPGSGKGTQGKALKTLSGFFHCVCGDVFRSVDSRTGLGQLFQNYATTGRLVPDEVTIQLWLEYLSTCQRKKTFHPDNEFLVLDGIPRNVHQARLLEPFIEVEAVFHLKCESKAELLTRIQHRATREKRADDASESVIIRRLEVYERESQPLLSHYSLSKLFHLDALQPPEAIHNQIVSCCHRLFRPPGLPFNPTPIKVSYEL